MASDENNIQFTISVENMVRMLLTDPQTEKEVRAALQKGPAEKTTNPVGFANRGTTDNPDWFSLFISTNRELQAGQDGFIYRTRPNKDAGETIGPRICARLRRQTKNQLANDFGGASSDVRVLAGAELLRRALLGDAEAAALVLSRSEQAKGDADTSAEALANTGPDFA